MDCKFRLIMAWKCNVFFGQFSEPKLQDSSSKEEKRNRGEVLLTMHTYSLNSRGKTFIDNL